MAKNFSVAVNIGGKLNPSLSGAVKAAGSQVSRLGAHVAAVNTRAQSAINGFGKGLGNAGKKLQGVGAGLSASVTAPLGLLGKIGFDAAYQFEKLGNEVQAVSNITDDQRKSLTAYIKELNAAFPYTNAQIMGAQGELLKGGLEYAQAFGALKPTLNLAASGDIDLASAADIASNVLQSMNLPKKTAAEAQASITKVADTLAYAANKSSSDVRLMGETLKYVGPMARAAGMDLDKVTAASMIMADNGIKGSEAGVALRSALVRMVKPTDAMMGALGRLNVNLGDFVKSGREITSKDILSSLAVDGIDASGAKRAIDGLLKNKKLQAAPGEMIKSLTGAISKTLGSDSVVDKSKLADNISEAMTTAGSQVDLGGFMKALKDRGATLGDIARIFDARQGARLITLLFEGNLNAAAEEVAKNAAGAADKMREIRMKGIVGDVGELSAALENLSTTIGESGGLRDIGRGLRTIADGLKTLGEQNPTLLRFATWSAMAAAALGPFMFVAGTATRVLGFLAPALLTLGRAATFGLASRLVSVAAGVRALTVAAAIGGAGRLRAMAAGLIALNAVGGSRAALAAIGGSIASFGRSVLLFPVTALRAITAPLLTIGGLTAAGLLAITAAFVALGIWVSNNWSGLQSFFSGFADGLKAGLNPTLSGYLDSMVSGFGSLFSWVSQLLGPLQATNAEWQSWGATVGGVVASGINAVADGISRVIGFFSAAIDKAIAFKDALAGAFSGAAATPPHIAAGISRGGPIPSAPAVAGARASGGPVMGGRTYLVGEEGPELFTAPGSGSIVPNDRLRSLSSAKNIAGRAGPGARGDVHVTNHFTISGAQDPRAVAREVERFMWRMESEQRALLSD